MRKARLVMGLILGLLLFVPLLASADTIFPVSMTTLVNGGSIVEGDKTFTNFSDVSIVTFGGATAITTDDIFFQAPDQGVFGLDYQIIGLNVGSGQGIDITFGYDVIVTSPVLIDNELILSGVGVTGTGNITITETVTDVNGVPLASKMVVDILPITDARFFDQAFYGPTDFVHVEKDISLTGGTSGTAALSDFEQNFSQKVPEPISLILLGSGLAGAGLYRRLRRK